jgi:hypothetical protein
MAKKEEKTNTVNKQDEKRTPIERIPVQKGTGKTFKAKEGKKTGFLKNMPEPQRKAILMAGGLLVGSVMVQILFNLILQKDKEDHEKAQNEVFDVVSNNCSSLGVNKMAIVDKVSKMIRSERLKRKSGEKRIKELEKFILNYNSVSKEEMDDMLQEIKAKNENNG